jgi:hypothetical protein
LKELGRFCGTDGFGRDTGDSSGRSEGAGAGVGAGGSSGGDGKGQSGQMTVHMGALLAVRVAPTMCWRGQRTANASTCPSGVGLPCCIFTVLFG